MESLGVRASETPEIFSLNHVILQRGALSAWTVKGLSSGPAKCQGSAWVLRLPCLQAGAVVLGLDGEASREGPRTPGGNFKGIEGSVDSSGVLSPISRFPDDLSKKLSLHYPSQPPRKYKYFAPLTRFLCYFAFTTIPFQVHLVLSYSNPV